MLPQSEQWWWFLVFCVFRSYNKKLQCCHLIIKHRNSQGSWEMNFVKGRRNFQHHWQRTWDQFSLGVGRKPFSDTLRLGSPFLFDTCAYPLTLDFSITLQAGSQFAAFKLYKLGNEHSICKFLDAKEVIGYVCLGSKIHRNSDCERKRHLLLGRKTATDLD